MRENTRDQLDSHTWHTKSEYASSGAHLDAPVWYPRRLCSCPLALPAGYACVWSEKLAATSPWFAGPLDSHVIQAAISLHSN